ncbi:MAG: hypothetical protein NC082_06785 [Clostridiales bacterium]|nr:hypothetical protein [Clostridiales bacterium]
MRTFICQLFTLFILTVSVGNICAQSKRIRIIAPDSTTVYEASRLNLNDIFSESTKEGDKVANDTAYYTNIVRRHSWLVGTGDSLSHDEALKKTLYYRLTMKNEKGYWQHIEAMNRDNHTYTNQYMYFKNYDPDNSIRQDIDSICQWFQFADFDGETILEERSYDSTGNLLFSLQFNRLPDNRIVASYNDKRGLPVDFDNDSRYKHGHVALITYNSSGLDSCIVYLDGAGNSRPSELKVYEKRIQYDENDEIIKSSYHNPAGDLMDTDGGVAYYTYTVDPEKNTLTRSNYDHNHNPVKPHYSSDILDNFQTKVWYMDKDGNVTQIAHFIMENGQLLKDEISNIHRITFAPDGSYTIFDINDKVTY